MRLAHEPLAPTSTAAERELTTNLFYSSGPGTWSLRVTHGAWPTDVGGYAFIIGPNKDEPRDHWFAGDGIVLRMGLEPAADGTLPVMMRVLDNPARRLRRIAPWLFRRVGGMLEVSPLGFTNYANTNVELVAGRLFAGYDVGRPLELDPTTLEVIGAVGGVDDWVPSLPGLADPLLTIAAHPGVDHAEHALYFVNYTQGPTLGSETYLVRYGFDDGTLRRHRLEKLGPYDTIHDVKVTQRYVVFADLPFVQELDRHKPRRAAQSFTNLYVVRKADLVATADSARIPVQHVRLDLPTGHLLAAYADGPNEELIVYLEHTPATDLPLAISSSDRRALDPERGFAKGHEGLASLGAQPAAVGRYRIDVASGRVLEHALAYDVRGVWGATLTTSNQQLESSRHAPKNLFWAGAGYDPRLVSERYLALYRHHPGLLVPLDPLPRESRAAALQRIDLEAMRVADIHRFEAGALPQPPTFVPRKKAAHDLDGYILVLVHADEGKRFELFDAAHLSRGPVAVATAAGFCPPLLLHSTFMPELPAAAPKRARPRLWSELKSRLRAQRVWWRHVGRPMARARRRART